MEKYSVLSVTYKGEQNNLLIDMLKEEVSSKCLYHLGTKCQFAYCDYFDDTKQEIEFTFLLDDPLTPPEAYDFAEALESFFDGDCVVSYSVNTKYKLF